MWPFLVISYHGKVMTIHFKASVIFGYIWRNLGVFCRFFPGILVFHYPPPPPPTPADPELLSFQKIYTLLGVFMKRETVKQRLREVVIWDILIP